MKRTLLASIVSVLALFSVATIFARYPTIGSDQDAAAPWQVGRCYRVFLDRDQLYVFQVLEPVAGQWVRVQEDPAGIRVPRARPQAPLWLNVTAIFPVQEWSCSR